MKKNVLVQAAAYSMSGYGVYGKDLILALHKTGKFNVGLHSLQWAQSSFNTYENEEYNTIKELEVVGSQMIEAEKTGWKPDIFIHCTIPNEWENTNRGIFNIGATAGIEVDAISPVWVEKINEMDLVFTISEHSKNVIEETSYNNGIHKVTTPIVAVPISVDTDIYKPQEHDEEFSKELNLLTKRNLFYMGQWGSGGYGEDRKNITKLIHLFCEHFNEKHKGHKEVGLVLRIHERNFSQMDLEKMISRVIEIKKSLGCSKEYPKIYVFGGSLKEEEFSKLYNLDEIEMFCTLTHGEGQGMPMLEAATCGLPVMCTAWSGHMDFLDQDSSCFVKYGVSEIPKAIHWKGVIEEKTRWAEPDDHYIKKMFEKWYYKTGFKAIKKNAKEHVKWIQDNYTRDKISDKYMNALKENKII